MHYFLSASNAETNSCFFLLQVRKSTIPFPSSSHGITKGILFFFCSTMHACALSCVRYTIPRDPQQRLMLALSSLQPQTRSTAVFLVSSP
ncbi:Protein of unknown function [Pyronema omphalodes CBS 100304]|uniref:Uncharacterized protein n=1 Tax=Pyronema omphalodes (strain CBS 100304) TaxID=1076935 RepID=U4LHC1_PYROM|nr:Protein of unknown function [Pyronema omphalodes CBS 100304]